MMYVVGSGPAGAACAFALVERGLEVTMLDAGIDLEPDIGAIIDKMGSSSVWSDESVQVLKRGLKASVGGVQLKRVYGSDYPYRGVEGHIPFECKRVQCRPSFGKGGLSSVWGAALLPYRRQEVDGWPLSIEEMAPHYKKVLSFMGISGFRDELLEHFPLYTDKLVTFNLSKQALDLLATFERSKSKLESEGIAYGRARLAVQFESVPSRAGCVYCGLCLYGCPLRLIYSSAQTVKELEKRRNFHYRNDVVIYGVSEDRHGVLIKARSVDKMREWDFSGSRVFLGCGSLSTTRIMLESLRMGSQVLLKDSQYFLLPLLTHGDVEGVAEEKLYSLAQLYLEIFDKEIDLHSIHLQVYTYNDLYEHAFKALLKGAYGLLKKPIDWLLNRLLVVQGYLHSDSSAGIVMRLKRGQVVLSPRENPRTEKIVKRVVKKLYKNRKHLKLTPLLPLLKIGKPGEGNHYGGSFPMSENPASFQSDILGRPFGCQRIHLVDASVFPTIPAQTITLTVMANAHRIASQVALEEGQ